MTKLYSIVLRQLESHGLVVIFPVVAVVVLFMQNKNYHLKSITAQQTYHEEVVECQNQLIDHMKFERDELLKTVGNNTTALEKLIENQRDIRGYVEKMAE